MTTKEGNREGGGGGGRGGIERERHTHANTHTQETCFTHTHTHSLSLSLTHSHTQEMCFNAFARLANPKEPAEAYEEKVIARVKETVVRLRYANEVMPDVKDDIQGLC